MFIEIIVFVFHFQKGSTALAEGDLGVGGSSLVRTRVAMPGPVGHDL